MNKDNVLKNKKYQYAANTGTSSSVFFTDLFKRKNLRFYLLILITVPLFMYARVTTYEYLWDDDIHLFKNPYLNPLSMDNLFLLWTHTYRKLYIPFAYTVWGLIQVCGHFFSNDSNIAFFYHFASLAFHTINGLLIFTILRFIIKNNRAALAGALLFLIHPIQVESVAWVSELRGLLAACFGFSSLYLHLLHIRTQNDHPCPGSLKHLYISWLFFVLAILSKPSAAVIPFFAALIENYLYQTPWKKIFFRILPCLLITAVISIVTVFSQSFEDATHIVSPLWVRPLIWMDATLFYFYKTVAPFSLSASYARTPAYLVGQWWFYVEWIIPVLTGYFAWRSKAEHPIPVLSFSIFMAGFLPVSGLLPFVFQSWSTVADRYLYFSMAGASLIFAHISDSIHSKKTFSLAVILLVFYGCLSAFFQIPVWKNALTLWNNCIHVMPMESRAYYNRGLYHNRHNDYGKALRDYNQAISINPLYADAYYNIGLLYNDLKIYDKALENYNRAIEIDPLYVDAYNNRGNLYGRLKEYDKALNDFKRAIKIKPDYALAYYHCGLVYQFRNEFEQAIVYYKKALEVSPAGSAFQKKIIFQYNNALLYIKNNLN